VAERTQRLAAPGEPERTKRLAVPPAQADEAPAAAQAPAPAAGPPSEEAHPAPERVPGPPLKLPGREAHDVERRPARRNQPVHVAELAPPAEPVSELDLDVAAAARQMPEVVGDDLALATEVAAAVETETDEDAEWAQLARGPEAFPGEERPDAPPEDEGNTGQTD
jgi:hypothetical protein